MMMFIKRLICKYKGHDWETYVVSTVYWSHDIEQAGFCLRCGADTHEDKGVDKPMGEYSSSTPVEEEIVQYQQAMQVAISEIEYALYSNKSEDVKTHYLNNAIGFLVRALEENGVEVEKRDWK